MDPASRATRTTTGYSRGFLLTLAISLVGTMSSGLVAPILPRFAESELGGGLLAGPRVDSAGRRVTAVAGLALAFVGALMLIPADSVGLTVLARSVFGAGAGVAAAATITWAVDQVPPDRRGRALSVFGLTVWIGLSVGPQLGQAIFDASGFAA